MIQDVLGYFGIVWRGGLLSVSEVLVVLLVCTLVVLATSLLLAAAAVAFRRRNARRRTRMDERSAAWRDAVQEVLYDGADASELSNSVSPSDVPYFLNLLLKYVRRLDGDERDTICRLAEPHLHSVLHFMSHRSPTRRMRTIQMLGELRPADAQEPVVAALDDPSPLVAMVAATTLARHHAPEHAAAILDRLARFEHWRRDFLAAMLASMGADALAALRETLRDDERTPTVRAAAADALAALSDSAAADDARDVLVTTDDVELQAATLRLLASVGRLPHLPAVRQWLDPEQALPVRLAAIRAVGRFGGPEDVAPLVGAARDDPSPWVAIAAARALKDAGASAELEILAGSDHPRSALGLQVLSEAGVS